MPLGTFVQASYALLVRAYAGIPGKNLLEAIDFANNSFFEVETETVPEQKPQVAPVVKTQPGALMSILPGGKMPG